MPRFATATVAALLLTASTLTAAPAHAGGSARHTLHVGARVLEVKRVVVPVLRVCTPPRTASDDAATARASTAPPPRNVKQADDLRTCARG